MRIIEKLDVNKISFCLNSQPANRLKLFKSEAKMKNLIKSFLGPDEEDLEDLLFKADRIPPKARKVLEDSIEMLNKYIGDFPDDVANSIKKLSKLAIEAQSYGYGYPKRGEKENKSKMKKSTILDVGKQYEEDPFPSFHFVDGRAVSTTELRKMLFDNEDFEEEEDKENPEVRRPGIKKSLEGQDDELPDENSDPWPSL